MVYVKKKRVIQNLKDYQFESSFYASELKELNKMRKELGLIQIKHISRKCLRCSKEFQTINPGGKFLCCGGKEDDNFTY